MSKIKQKAPERNIIRYEKQQFVLIKLINNSKVPLFLIFFC